MDGILEESVASKNEEPGDREAELLADLEPDEEEEVPGEHWQNYCLCWFATGSRL